MSEFPEYMVGKFSVNPLNGLKLNAPDGTSRGPIFLKKGTTKWPESMEEIYLCKLTPLECHENVANAEIVKSATEIFSELVGYASIVQNFSCDDQNCVWIKNFVVEKLYGAVKMISSYNADEKFCLEIQFTLGDSDISVMYHQKD